MAMCTLISIWLVSSPQGASTSTGCLKKSSPVKHFEIFPLQLSLFTWNFVHLLAIHSPIYITANYCRFILYIIFHQMALIFPRVYPSFSPCRVLSRPIHPENENAAVRKWRHFFLVACFSVHCKQSITVWFFTINVLLRLF